MGAPHSARFEPTVRAAAAISDTPAVVSASFSHEFALTVDIRYRMRRFETDPGEAHIHDCVEVGYCHEGRGMFQTAGRYAPFAARAISIVNNREAHAVRYYRECTWSWIRFDPELLLAAAGVPPALLDAGRLCDEGFVNVAPGADHPDLEATVLQIIGEYEYRRSHWQTAVRGLATALMAQINRAWPEQPAAVPNAPLSGDGSLAAGIGPALDYIHRHCFEEIPSATLLKLTGMPEKRFRRVFRAVFGTAPFEYRAAFRITAACRMLRDSARNIGQIARDTGFEDDSAFHRAFRRLTGTSPGHWRKGGTLL